MRHSEPVSSCLVRRTRFNLYALETELPSAKGQSCTLGEFGSTDRRDFVSRNGRLGGASRVPYRMRLDLVSESSLGDIGRGSSYAWTATSEGLDAAPPRSQNDILEGRSFAHTMRSVYVTY